MLFELRLPLFVCTFFMPFTEHNERTFHGNSSPGDEHRVNVVSNDCERCQNDVNFYDQTQIKEFVSVSFPGQGEADDGKTNQNVLRRD